MQWLGMQPDEGPFYQMQRMDRYREVVAQMLKDGTAYYCYSSPEEVEAMREKARAAGLKPRYDGTWRPESGKTLPSVPADRKPVRSEEHTSELQSLMRISYAVFCLQKKTATY